MPIPEPTIVVVDRICWASLWHLARWHAPAEIRYIEPMSRQDARWLRIFMRLRLVRATVQHVAHHMGQVREPDGSLAYARILHDARRLCEAIRQECTPLLADLVRFWDRDRVVFYIEKLSETVIRKECLRIALVCWVARREHREIQALHLVIQQNPWLGFLRTYAQQQGLEVRGYPQWPGVFLVRGMRIVGTLIGQLAESMWRRIRNTPRVSLGEIPWRAGSGSWAMAIRYWHRALTRDPSTRSELFWLPQEALPVSEVLLYDPDQPVPADPMTRAQLAADGIRILPCGPRLSLRALALAANPMGSLMRQATVRLLGGHWRGLWTAGPLARLAIAYGCWMDFFITHRIRLHVAAFNYKPTDVAIALALEKLGGISVAYDYSISGLLLCPMAARTAAEHVQFVFSPYFEQLWRRIGAPIEQCISVGYIYDQAFEPLRGQARIARMRAELAAHGARFVLCFFDENSSDVYWDRYASNADAATDYESLCNWILAEPTLGVVIKAKQAATLFDRVRTARPLIERAIATGRCRVLTNADESEDSMFPAEAALMADLCIGKLSGSTAAFEAQLVGVPTVLIDTEGFSNHPLRGLLRTDGVIFDGWSVLRQAVDRCRSNQNDALGKWPASAGALEPFQDGSAAQRMAAYLRWLLQDLQAGHSVSVALSNATNKYEDQWGRQLQGRIPERPCNEHQEVLSVSSQA